MPIAQKKVPENPIRIAGAFLDKGREHFRNGNLKEAEGECRKALDLNPHFPETWFLLGTIVSKRGHPEEATEYFRKAVTIRPAYALFRVGLGSNYLVTKKIPDAVEQFEKAVFLEPARAKPYISLGLTYLASGKAGKGFATFFKALSIKIKLTAFAFGNGLKDAPRGKYDFARAKFFSSLGFYNEALAILAKKLNGPKETPELLDVLANVYADSGSVHTSHIIIEEGLEKYPDNVNLLTRKSSLLCRPGRLEEAFEALEQVKQEDRTKPGYLIALAFTCFRNNQAEKALEILNSIETKNLPVKFYIIRGRCLAGLGKLEDAIGNFLKATKVNPKYGGAYGALAKCKALTPGKPIFGQLQRLLQSPFVGQKERMQMFMATGAAYAEAKDFDKAFAAYNKGNSLRDIPFDQADWSEWIDRLSKTFTKKFIAEKQRLGSKSKKPIFIVGMPRSGTTLTEQILAAHPDVAGAGERDILAILIQDFVYGFSPEPAWPEAAALLDKKICKEMEGRYLKDVEQVSSQAKHITDKMPGNFHNVGLIHILFPEAKIIHCRRDPVDTCLSNYMQPYLTFHPYAFDLGNLGFYYREYERLMKHWHKVMPGKILDVQYEDVVSNLEKEGKRLLKFCGLPWDPACLEFHKAETTVQTSSFAQVRQPIYKTSSKKWKKYEAHLGPLFDALEKK